MRAPTERMVALDLLERCPELSEAELSAQISAEVGHEEFLFYRVSQGDDLDWILGAGRDGYEMFCTACGQHFFEPRDRKHPAKDYTYCPQCGVEISPKRWRDRARLESIEFAYHVFQHGEGADVWLRSFQVSMDRNFMGRKYDIFEYCRILFQPGGAHKWTRSRSWYNGVSAWKPVKSICLKRWHGNYGQTRNDIWAGVTMEEMEGSCLQYVPMDEVMRIMNDPINFLALWCKYPAVEYVWKMGFGAWFAQRERGSGAAFSRVVNLRAKRPDKLFPHLSKSEIRLLRRRTGLISINDVELYQRLKKAGAVEPGAAGMEFAREVNMSRYIDFFALAERCGATPRELRKYLQKQAGRRAGTSVYIVMQELDDYLGQLNRLGVQGGDRMPRDLHEAHERLSARERKLQNAPLNSKFRARRHLLRWMCWKHDGMFIRPVDSAEEITREGEQQSNCVAGYAKRHAEGKTIILLLRKCSAPGESWHTVEIEPETLRCKQCFGHGNARRTPEAAAFMEAYLAHLQAVRPGRRQGRKERRAA